MHSWRRCPARPDGDIRPEAILSTSFGSLRTAIHRQVTCTCQIWIPGWILPHFDVRTISVASKLKKLQIFLYYWQKIFDGTKLDSDGERSSGCECYSWRLIIPAHTLQHCTVGEYFDWINTPNTPIGQKPLIWPTVQCCTAAGALLRHQTRLFTDTLQNLFWLLLKIREKKVLLWTLWFGNSERGWWCYGSSTFPGTTWTQAGRCVVSSVSVKVYFSLNTILYLLRRK